MAVNGIEIKVGQKWRRVDGQVVKIVMFSEDPRRPVVATAGSEDPGKYTNYNIHGQYSALEPDNHPCNLATLVET